MLNQSIMNIVLNLLNIANPNLNVLFKLVLSDNIVVEKVSTGDSMLDE